MKVITATISILMLTLICSAQTTQTKFYNNPQLEEEVSPKKAKFSQTITQNLDGTITTTNNFINKNTIVQSQTFKGEEPFGIWTYQRMSGPAELDYNFQLEYSTKVCSSDNASLKISNYFENNDSLGYVAPKITTGEQSIYSFIGNNLDYSAKARRAGIQGKVYLVFNITKESTIENISVLKGVHILLDKEAVRVLRKLNFSSPPLLNGQPQHFCVTMPITFKLK